MTVRATEATASTTKQNKETDPPVDVASDAHTPTAPNKRAAENQAVRYATIGITFSPYAATPRANFAYT
jgi:hypothetical protein